MKKISRILTMLLCCAPLAVVHAAPVATTAGSNLTAYHPNNVNNNQWATMTNGRYDGNTTTAAKANFGNCNSIVLRCAQPKCSNGGCSDISVASAIVNGCVQSNETCKQYGDDLVNYMSAQLVASSNAKINEQQLAAQQAAAAAASAESQQQMVAMQQQMQQMQQQMIQQQQESQQQLQSALAQQAAQSQAAIEEMKSAATDAAKQTEAGISSYQQDAINRGISADVLQRQTMTGQIMTEIEDAEVSITTLKKTLENVFEYAKCDSHGNNCEGPKRVKKWREMAKEFIDPYDNAIDKVYGALEDAQGLGVDLSQIYMMLDNSCNKWGQYLCPKMDGGKIVYTDVSGSEKGTPKVCTDVQIVLDPNCARDCYEGHSSDDVAYKQCLSTSKCSKYEQKNCQPCTMLKVLSGEDAVYDGWVNAEGDTSQGNTTVVACASGVLDNSKFFARRARKKNGANLVDMEVLDTWLSQAEPSYKKSGTTATDTMKNYCEVNDVAKLQSATLSKVAPVKGTKLCLKDLGGTTEDKEDCPYIDPLYAICDTHPYNAGIDKIDGDSTSSLTEQTNKTKEIVGLKTTVVSQQMYKQYEYLKATIRRLKIQLEKAIVKTNLEAAGAKDEDGSSSSSGGLAGGGSSKASQYQNCSGKDREGTLYCLRSNYSALSDRVNSKKCAKTEKDQLKKDIGIIDTLTTKKFEYKEDSDCATNLGTYNAGIIGLQDEIEERQFKLRGWGDK